MSASQLHLLASIDTLLSALESYRGRGLYVSGLLRGAPIDYSLGPPPPHSHAFNRQQVRAPAMNRSSVRAAPS